MDRPRKLVVLLSVLIVLGVPAASQVQYSIESDNDDVMINTTLRLECDDTKSSCPVNKWRLPNWPLPEDSQIMKIEDSLGDIEDYNIEDNRLSIRTNDGEKRTSETVKINMRIDRGSEEVYRGLRKREFSLPGFSSKHTFGKIEMKDIISGRTTYGFDTSYGKDHFNFTGTGPVQVRLKAGKGNKTEFFEFFGDASKKDQSLAYEIPVAMTGQVQNFRRFPVAVMDSKTFNDSVGLWSAGEYIGGSIKIRGNLDEKFTPVLAHETVHGLNDRVLNWDQTRSSYIDEGTGKYVEYLVKMNLDGRDRVREIFGDDVIYTVRRNDGRYRIRLPSQGDRERLWRYYQEDSNFMKEWSPVNNAEERRFGYAYSELLIKNYIVNSNGSMEDIYSIDPGRKIDSNKKKWNLYSQKIDLTPCDYSDRQRFDECLDDINDFEYSVYRASEIDRELNRIIINDIEVPDRDAVSENETHSPFNYTPENSTKNGISGNGFSKWIESIYRALMNLLSS